jgi:hypothetical protein
MQSIIQIFKVDELKKGTSQKTGRPYEMQSAQCALLTPEGVIDQVGVLDIPPKLREGLTPGTYTAAFAMRASMQTGRLEAVLTGLMPVPAGSAKGATLPPAAAAKA